MSSPIDFRSVRDPALARGLEELRVEARRLTEQVSAPGVLSAAAVDALERVRPGSGSALLALATTGERGEDVLHVLLRELRAVEPSVGLPRWLTAASYDAAQAERGAAGVERITVTPRDAGAVSRLLKLSDRDLPALRGRRVLSVGEGASDFAKTLEARHGAEAVALDWWYGRIGSAALLVGERWHDSPIAKIVSPAEVAERLPRAKVAARGEALPFAGGAFEAVYLANILGWYFSPAHRERAGLASDAVGRRIIAEALRVASGSGEVRFNLFDRDHARGLRHDLQGAVRSVQQVGSTLILSR